MKYKGSEARRGGGAQTARNSRQSRSIPSFDYLQNFEKRVSLQLEIFWFLYFPVVTIRLEMSSRCLNSEPNPGISSKMKQKSKYLKLQRYSFFKILQAVKGWYGPALAWISRSLSTPTPARLRSYFPHTVVERTSTRDGFRCFGVDIDPHDTPTMKVWIRLVFVFLGVSKLLRCSTTITRAKHLFDVVMFGIFQ